jgi:hypothetical protein
MPLKHLITNRPNPGLAKKSKNIFLSGKIYG